MTKKLVLKLNRTRPDKLPMSRLAQYLDEFAKLCGHENHVSFKSVTSGSACLNAIVTDEAYPKVMQRIRQTKEGAGSKAAARAFQAIDEMLAEDGLSGAMLVEKAQIIAFPGLRKNQDAISLVEPGEIQGVLYSIGGKDDTIPVKLEGANGEVYPCQASRSVAKQLAPLLFNDIRVVGKGTWERAVDGWKLRTFDIVSFEVLQTRGAKEIAARIAAIGKSGWDNLDDPHAALTDQRH